jgi:hypothetical protein
MAYIYETTGRRWIPETSGHIIVESLRIKRSHTHKSNQAVRLVLLQLLREILQRVHSLGWIQSSPAREDSSAVHTGRPCVRILRHREPEGAQRTRQPVSGENQ